MKSTVRRRFWTAAFLALAWALPACAEGERAARLEAPAPVLSPFILDPGHGGEDLGAVVGGRMEKDIALAIARKVRDRLESLSGIGAKLTRDSDAYVPLDDRVERSLDLRGSAFISLHVNKVRYKKLSGITVYAYGKTHTASPRRRGRKVRPLPAPPREEVRQSAALAGSVAASLRARGFRVGAPERGDYYVLKNPGIPSILIELGYLSNPEEAKKLADPAYQDALASALAESLSSYASAQAAVDRRPERLARKP